VIGNIGTISFTWDFFLAFLSIVLIDLVLSGDNAVVIAMAVRNLPSKQRIRGITIGAGAAIVLRVSLTFVASQLLVISFVKLLGGVLITWVAVKLFIEGVPDEESKREVKTLGQAVVTIMIADITMSTDNILAVAGASKGNLFLLLFGLALSIPFLVFTSTLISMLMDKYPIIIYIGAAVLGRVAGDMIITDPFIHNLLHPSSWVEWAVQAFFAGGVIIAGKLWMKMKAMNEDQVLAKSAAEDAE
jgi:YjbE family integral membrane protein